MLSRGVFSSYSVIRGSDDTWNHVAHPHGYQLINPFARGITLRTIYRASGPAFLLRHACRTVVCRSRPHMRLIAIDKTIPSLILLFHSAADETSPAASSVILYLPAFTHALPTDWRNRNSSNRCGMSAQELDVQLVTDLPRSACVYGAGPKRLLCEQAIPDPAG